MTTTDASPTPDDAMILRLPSRAHLSALHRALMEAKFHYDPWDDAVQGSPLVADVANAVVELLIESEARQGNAQAANGWRAWRMADASRREVQCFERHISDDNARRAWWARQSPDARADYARAYLAPLIADDETQAALISTPDPS